MDTPACYRKLKSYKYQLMEEFHYRTDFELDEDVEIEFVKLGKEGLLTIAKYYSWDGASGPTYDSLNSMRASLVHDALYQLMRKKKLSQDYVLPVDQLFKKMLVKDGMSSFRAWYWYQGLRLAAGKHAQPHNDKEDKIICVGKI